MKKIKMTLRVLLFISFFFLGVKTTDNYVPMLEIEKVRANPALGVVLAAKLAYKAYKIYKKYDKASRTAKRGQQAKNAEKARRDATKKCTRLLESYQALKGTAYCRDSCAGMPGGEARTQCYGKIRRNISSTMDKLKAERTGRSNYEKICAKNGLGRVKLPNGRRKGQRVGSDKGHDRQIEDLTSQIMRCNRILQKSNKTNGTSPGSRSPASAS